ncbi:MAG: hypothetical protein LBE20_02405, partial [Deltaproteobacteria bacterium]|nr:hypothetical protein [Deltaproteobacteria bacterium]
MRKIVLTLVSFLVALPALAEEVKKTFVQEVNKTSTATLVASALESAGYKAQEIVLKQFHEELILLASLVFVCCAIRGMFSILLDKKYLPVLWMVTGPVIFLVLINATTKADAVDWQFAKEKKENEVKEVLEGTENKEVKESAKGSEVSWFFHEYNRMVSAIIQEIIETLSNDSAKNHYIFTIRQQLFSEMLSSDLLQTDQGMQYFVRDTVAICADVMERARLIAMKRRENLNNDEKKNNEIKAMIDEYNKKLKSNERVNLGDVKGPYLQKVFNQIRTEDSPQFKTKYFEAVKGTLNNYLGFDNALEKAFDSDGEALSALKNEGFTNFEMLS